MSWFNRKSHWKIKLSSKTVFKLDSSMLIDASCHVMNKLSSSLLTWLSCRSKLVHIFLQITYCPNSLINIFRYSERRVYYHWLIENLHHYHHNESHGDKQVFIISGWRYLLKSVCFWDCSSFIMSMISKWKN